jgi:tetratricopeptide (TPR) repeat protein
VADLLASARRAANQGRYEAALEDAKRAAAAATVRQDRAAAHVISGDVLDVMTNYAGATREYETALAIDPTNRQAASRLDIIRKGRRGSQ